MSLISPLPRLRGFPPGARLEVSRRALDRGLIYIFMGDGSFWTRDLGFVTYTTKNGSPRDVAREIGIFKGFGSTSGGGSSDYLVGPPMPIGNGFRSHVWHFLPNSGGGGGLGRIQQPNTGNGGDAGEAAFLSANALTYSRFSSAQNQWQIGSSMTYGVPNIFGITHDQRSATTPVSYRDGLSTTTAVLTAPGGTYSNGTHTPVWGNRISDVARGWDGWIGRCPIFEHPREGLRPDEHYELAMDPDGFLFFERPILVYFPYGTSTLPVSIVEAASAAESSSQHFGASGIITEAAAVASSETSSAAQSTAISESAALGESTGGSATGEYTGTRTEAASLDSTAAQVWAGAATQTEAASAAETCGVVLGKAAAVSEGASLDSSQLLSATLSAIIAEAMSLAAAQSQQAYGHFICDTMENGSGSVWASTAAKYNWLPSWRIGDALPSSGAVAGSGTFDASGVLSVLLPLGQSGVMMYSKPNTDAGDDDVAYMHGTVV